MTTPKYQRLTAIMLMLLPALLAGADTQTPVSICHWLFDEAEGVVIIDHSQNGNSAEIFVEGVNRALNLLGNVSEGLLPSIHFDGTPIADLEIPAAVASTALADQIPGTFSISLWINPDSLQPLASILAKVTDPDQCGDGFGLFLGESGELSAFIGSANGGTGLPTRVDDDPSLNPPIPARPGAWSHIALTSDGETVSLYINGRLHSSAVSEDPNLAVNNAPVTLGTLSSEIFSLPYHGHIADVRIFDTTLTDAEIFDLFTSTPVSELVDSLDIGIPDLWALFFNLNPWDPTLASQVLQPDSFTVKQKYLLGMNPTKTALVSPKPLLKVYTPLEK